MSDSSSPDVADRKRLMFAFRAVQWCTLAALAWKIGPFIQMLRCYFSTPLHLEFFPSALESPVLLAVTYLLATSSLGCAALLENFRLRYVACWVLLAAQSVLCIHQGSYNDMTFATAWWTALWSVWLAGRIDRDEPSFLLRRAAFLARCIVSMIFLGGAVGKWTDEYWSGQALYEIYFVDRDFWFFNWLRSALEPEDLRVAATWYSRKVIVVESLCGFGLWLLPPRAAAAVGVLVLTSIAVFFEFQSIFSTSQPNRACWNWFSRQEKPK